LATHTGKEVRSDLNRLVEHGKFQDQVPHAPPSLLPASTQFLEAVAQATAEYVQKTDVGLRQRKPEDFVLKLLSYFAEHRAPADDNDDEEAVDASGNRRITVHDWAALYSNQFTQTPRFQFM
jgi:hypothetical protein